MKVTKIKYHGTNGIRGLSEVVPVSASLLYIHCGNKFIIFIVINHNGMFVKNTPIHIRNAIMTADINYLVDSSI